jgi:uncharacterized protein (TIGR02266 family)
MSPGGRRTILFADDSSMFRDLAAIFLSRSAEVVTASDGVEALELMRRERPDVLVADLWMPRMDGESLCRAVRGDRALCDVPIVLLTSGEQAEERERAVRAGADDVLPKPLHRGPLIQAVNRFLRSSDAALRGLPRIALDAPVQIRSDGWRERGRVLNLSRGGIFVTADQLAPVDSEVEISFQLPASARPLSSTARVVWTRKSDDAPTGMGLRFLGLDRRSARAIEEFVYENCPVSTRQAIYAPQFVR